MTYDFWAIDNGLVFSWSMEFDGNLIGPGNPPEIFISDTQCFVRTLGGKFVRSFQENNNKSYEIVPGSFVSK